MLNMIPEQQFKKRLIGKLNNINKGWIDGDREPGQAKKVDLLNHKLKIALEIKDDTNYEIEASKGLGSSQTIDLTKMNQRFSDQAKSSIDLPLSPSLTEPLVRP